MVLPDEVIGFEGKRNTVLTFMIPPYYEFKKDLNKILRITQQIKHQNKKTQILAVLKKIDVELQDATVIINKGGVICCGLDNMNEVCYYFLDSPSLIKKFEYYFDYKFHIERINEIFNEDVVEILNEKDAVERLKKIEGSILACDHKIQLGAEVEQSINNSICKNIIVINSDVLERYIEQSRNSSIKIYKINSVNEYVVNFSIKYGNTVSELYY
jgi:hypothetical protein